MPIAVHKMLVYVKQVIEKALLPIGQLSKEAQEKDNKDNKKFRSGFSRKFSRVQTMEDIFNLLLFSDPYILSFRKLYTKRIESCLLCR